MFNYLFLKELYENTAAIILIPLEKKKGDQRKNIIVKSMYYWLRLKSIINSFKPATTDLHSVLKI